MNPNLNAFLFSVHALLIVIGGVLAEHGLEHSTAYAWIMICAGSIMVVGPAIWGVWISLVNWRKATAIGVQAGINLTLSGKALAADGTSITNFGAPGSTPLKPVTQTTGSQIVKDFGPSELPAK